MLDRRYQPNIYPYFFHVPYLEEGILTFISLVLVVFNDNFKMNPFQLQHFATTNAFWSQLSNYSHLCKFCAQ